MELGPLLLGGLDEEHGQEPDAPSAPGEGFFSVSRLRLAKAAAAVAASVLVLIAAATGSSVMVSLAFRQSAVIPSSKRHIAEELIIEQEALEDGLRPWSEAVALAAQTNAELSAQERWAILSGNGYKEEAYKWVGLTNAVPRLGIPALKIQDASAGFRSLGPEEFGTTTAWPCMLALGATWDVDMVAKVAGAIADEFAGKGANVLLGPGLNVHRSPFGGRNFEYLPGEDPKLGAVLGSAYVRAAQRRGVMVTAKHFAFNEQETQRASSASIVYKRTARELYMPPFLAAIEAGAGAFMCSYNKIGKTFACESAVMLKSELRQRMGFHGLVMSDWWAVHSPAALANGLDIEMPGPKYVTNDTMMSMQPAASQAAEHVLASIYHLRLDEHPGCVAPCAAQRHSNQRTPEHVELAADAAAKSIVLLQNKGALPINPLKVRKLAILGQSDVGDTMNTWGAGSPYSGGGSGHVASPFAVTPLKGIQQRAAQAGIDVLSPEQADDADLIIFVGTTTTTENADRATLSLDGSADADILRWSMTKEVVVLLEVPGVVLTPWRGQTSAIACLFAGGEQTGNAWASVLFGDVYPEGRLPVTFPASLDHVVRPGFGQVMYAENLETGYRNSDMEVAFPFGHGLTYTKFSQSDPVVFLDGCDEVLCVTVVVENEGTDAGREVVQGYIRFYEVDGRHGPYFLRAFKKTATIQPGGSEAVTLRFSERDLSTFDLAVDDFVQSERFELFTGSSASVLSLPVFVNLADM